MNGIEDTLKKVKSGHVAILDTLDRIEAVIRQYNQVKPKLRDLQEQMFSHFSTQSPELYQRLEEHFHNDRQKSKSIEFLSVNLKDIKVRTLLFFDEYPADMGDLHPINFPTHFMDFAGEVVARIKSEESYLIPLLTELES